MSSDNQCCANPAHKWKEDFDKHEIWLKDIQKNLEVILSKLVELPVVLKEPTLDKYCKKCRVNKKMTCDGYCFDCSRVPLTK